MPTPLKHIFSSFAGGGPRSRRPGEKVYCAYLELRERGDITRCRRCPNEEGRRAQLNIVGYSQTSVANMNVLLIVCVMALSMTFEPVTAACERGTRCARAGGCVCDHINNCIFGYIRGYCPGGNNIVCCLPDDQ